MNNGGLPEPLSHIADRVWSMTAQCRSLVQEMTNSLGLWQYKSLSEGLLKCPLRSGKKKQHSSSHVAVLPTL